jgi:aspartyl-tRNA(Asn)/glutamyl-tRNA(Gln) amidotransferase subunit A
MRASVSSRGGDPSGGDEAQRPSRLPRSASDDYLAFTSLRDAAGLVDRGDVSAVELVEIAIGRAETIGRTLNCFVTVLADSALRAARDLDRVQRRGGRRGCLHGVPISVKDNIAVAGRAPTAGSSFLAELPERGPGGDAAAVARLRRAGAVVFATTALYEFAFGEANVEFGHTGNPWDAERSPAGSSSGSVAAVAAGIGYGSLATDTGGSIRVPAAFCGVVGLKPTQSAVSRGGVVPVSVTLDHVGPVAREAADTRLLFEALAGPTSSTVPTARLTLGAAASQPSEVCSDEVRAAVRASITALEDAGTRVVGVELPDLLEARAALWTIAGFEAARVHRKWLREHASRYHPLVRARLERGLAVSLEEYDTACRARGELAHALSAVFEQVDAVVLPTAPSAAYGLGARRAEVAGTEEDVSELVTRYTPLFSLAGCPAISVQCGVTAGGLPIGMQIAAAPGNDSIVLSLAEVFQSVTTWHRLHPPTAASASEDRT